MQLIMTAVVRGYVTEIIKIAFINHKPEFNTRSLSKKNTKKFFLPNLNASMRPGFSSLANSSAAIRQTAPPARAITASFIRPKIMQ